MSAEAPVGVVVVAHGSAASALLSCVRNIVGPDALSDIVVLDAGLGRTPELAKKVAEGVAAQDQGRGVVLLVDLFGSSPWCCGDEQCRGRISGQVGGLNLAMLLKLATLDRHALSPTEIVEACAASGVKAIDASKRCSEENAP